MASKRACLLEVSVLSSTVFSDMPVKPSFCMLATVAAYSLCLRFDT